jgi:hypothetical protein
MGGQHVSACRRTDRGAAAVETALLLPVLLLIIFGIIDFGRLLNAQITLTEAGREGARAVALETDPSPRVNTVMQNLGAPDAIQSVPCGPNPDPDDDAQVTVEYTFSFITPVGALAGIFTGGGGFGGDVSMQGVGIMPCRA